MRPAVPGSLVNLCDHAEIDARAEKAQRHDADIFTAASDADGGDVDEGAD